MSRFALPGLAGALLVMITACAGGSSSSNEATAPVQTPAAIPSVATPSAEANGVPHGAITIQEFEFMPARSTVGVGDAVTWTNEEDSLHTVTSGTPDARTGLFDSGEFDTGETFVYTFAEVGTYAFFCDRHEFMRGEVIVVP